MNDLALYQIADEYRALLDLAADEEADEESFGAALVALQGDFDRKAIAVAQVIGNLESVCTAIKQAVEIMMIRAKRAERRANAINTYLLEQMTAAGINKIESPWFVIAVQKNPPRVSVLDETEIPPEFMRIIPEKSEPDKIAILKAMKNGDEVPGCKIESTMRLKIK